MPNEQVFDRVVVILVRARNPNNIGAVARAMHDFGLRHLRIVNEYAVPFEAAKSAIDASAVLEGATLFSTVAEAVADCTLVVGTTAVGERALQHPLHELPEAAQQIHSEFTREGSGQVALLFGSEKTGLSNDDLSHCHWLLTIPMYQHEDIRHPSMNLGQAVAVCLYELVRRADISVPGKLPVMAGAGETERLTALLAEVLKKTEYTRHHPANSDEAQIRRLVMRLNLTATDVPVWMGILRQVMWKLRKTEAGGE